MIRSGFEPETHSLEGCCSIQLSYQTSSECACKKKLAPRVWLAAIPPLNPNSRSRSHFLRSLTAFGLVFKRLCTQNYPCRHTNKCLQRQFGCKSTAFFSIMQIIIQIIMHFFYKSSSKSFCKSGLRIAPTLRCTNSPFLKNKIVGIFMMP